MLLGALVLLPAESARTRALTALDRHADIGAWFAAIAGYAADRLITWLRPRAARVAATLATAGMLVFPARMAVAQAASLTKWPDAAGLVTALAPIVAPGGRLLVEEPTIAEYYLPARDGSGGDGRTPAASSGPAGGA